MNDAIPWIDAICINVMRLAAAAALVCLAAAFNRWKKTAEDRCRYIISVPEPAGSVATTTSSGITYTLETAMPTLTASSTPALKVGRPEPEPAPAPEPPKRREAAVLPPNPVPAPAPAPPEPVEETIECGYCRGEIRTQPVHSEVKAGKVVLVYLCEHCQKQVSVTNS